VGERLCMLLKVTGVTHVRSCLRQDCATNRLRAHAEEAAPRWPDVIFIVSWRDPDTVNADSSPDVAGPIGRVSFSRFAFRNLVNQRPRIRRACTHQYRRASAAKRRVVRSSSMSWRNQITSRAAANNVAWILGSCSADSGQRWPQHLGEATCPYPSHTTRRVVDISCATRCEAPPGSARRRRRSRWEW
jgi:hypothetical protein